MHNRRLVIAGGGAAGFFAAIAAAEHGMKGEIILLEKTGRFLSKVLISGGGRCNVTNACFDNSLLAGYYPRGRKELLGPFSVFNTADTVRWFETKGVSLKTETDGRIFPKTNQSQTIAACLLLEADRHGIKLKTNTSVTGFAKNDRFELKLSDNSTMIADYFLIATGGFTKISGYDWIREKGISIIPPVPSLFTFNIPDSPFKGLEGISIANACVKIAGSDFESHGPVLITHWGLSGPGILKLSALAARFLNERNYQFSIRLLFNESCGEPEMKELIVYKRNHFPSGKIFNDGLAGIPQRLWHRIGEYAGIGEDETWGQLRKEKQNILTSLLTGFEIKVSGKTTFKEEFVTCGGIDLREINFRTMESKKAEGLYFAGEVIDVDGLTGGFNFQNAWTTGWIAGRAIAKKSQSIVTLQS